MTAALAFYIGKGNWVDRMIRLITGSDYSHCEYVQNYALDHRSVATSTCLSSSARGGGVRKKQIDLHSGNWEVIAVPWHTADSRVFFAMHQGKKYDYLGVLFCQFFAFRWNIASRWFCSEICAAALGLQAPEAYSPGRLKLTVERLSKAHDESFARGYDQAKDDYDV